jgi:hypothetical protein
MKSRIPYAHPIVLAVAAVSLIVIMPGPIALADSDDHSYHPHHVSIPLGWLQKGGGKDAFAYGIEYEYRFTEKFGIGAFFESAEGDFDLFTYGIPFFYHPIDPVKLFLAGAYETKAFEHEYFLIRLGAGYDIHHGNFSFGPLGWYDFVETGKYLGFIGLGVGYGF